MNAPRLPSTASSDAVDHSITPLEGGGLLSVPGLRGTGVACGLKPSGSRDLALVVAREPWVACGMFTRSELPAAPVVISRAHLQERPAARALVINAGYANAMTGDQGLRDAQRMIDLVEASCGAPALVLSTGVIGVPLPMDRVEQGIADAAQQLAGDAAADALLAEAILTTDTVPKTCAVEVAVPRGDGDETLRFTVGGMAKGSGMIHPDMATMLAVIAVDLPVSPGPLRELLGEVVSGSFHEISVDGDTSTNDTVLLLAGDRKGKAVGPGHPAWPALRAALLQVAESLALQIVADGEGASRVMELQVEGANSDADARKVARAVAGSLLVKTALAGGDPNWGRILAAAAVAGVALQSDQLELQLGGTYAVRRGAPTGVERVLLEQAMVGPRVEVRLGLGSGPGRARIFTTDLTKDYVAINADYTT